MTEAPPVPPGADVDSAPAPWYRNPWIWGVIAGLVFVPAIRPFMRHIPDAPPVLVAVPEYELRLSGAGVLPSSRLLGRVYVLGMYGSACEPGCGEVLSALGQLSSRFVEFERGITVVAVRLAGEAGSGTAGVGDLSQQWLKLAADEGSLDLMAAQALAPRIDGLSSGSPGAAEVARFARLFLIDAAGNLRGDYGIDELGLDEVYHRAQHVLRDHTKVGEVPL